MTSLIGQLYNRQRYRQHRCCVVDSISIRGYMVRKWYGSFGESLAKGHDMNYYIDLFSPETYEAFARSDIWCGGFRASAGRVKQGDKLICCMGSPSKVAHDHK
jgi:hypothetical protein